MKIVIIPDIHHAIVKARRILDTESADQYVFLGDFVDQFNDSVTDMIKSCRFINELHEREDVITLVGNHDISYMCRYLRCSGWESIKQVAWDNAGINRTKFVPCWQKGKVLFTHASLAENIPLKDQKKAIEKVLTNTYEQSDLRQLDASLHDGGNLHTAGILWNRPQYRSPRIDSVYNVQVFGHSPQKYVTSTIVKTNGIYKGWMNLDTGLQNYAVMEFEEDRLVHIDIKETP